ncbi:unnamed protein product [Microthlaspi erraticum]|uniref:Acidic protein n=1 Tax=Microthlaspi erraticum TaxID=1685480 RepID=A0A6D2JRU9_9BRAS|nr:unnamed protein product [Microthlaspi erraticum]
MCLVMAQTQVEARQRACCPNLVAINKYNVCRIAGSQSTCASISQCILVDGSCPPGYPYGTLELNSGDAVNEYCKLGCVSSVCGAITTLQSFDKSEIVDGAVEQCTKACLTLCTKGSITTRGTA